MDLITGFPHEWETESLWSAPTKPCMHPRYREKGAVSSQKTEPGPPVRPEVSSGSMSAGPDTGTWALAAAVLETHMLELSPLGGCLSHTIEARAISGQTNNREGVQPHPTTENWIKDLPNMALPTRARPGFSLTQSR